MLHNIRLRVLVERGVAGVALMLAALFVSAGCGDDKDKVPPPGELQAGVAVRRINVPIGVGTVGYRGFGVDGPESPFSDIYPATVHMHGHPQFRALVISRGAPHELIFLRSDTVGIFQQFRQAVVVELENRLGRNVDDELVFGATHTHSGPGRVIDGGPVYELITDSFFPELYQRIIESAADAVMAAFDDLQPARLGHGWGECVGCHSDRRCEDGLDYTNDAMGVVAVERNGQIDALLFTYAIHGTLLGMEDFTLSRDAGGGMEEYVEAAFDHPVTALFFNSWAADMAPGHPEVDHQVGGDEPDGYERMTEVGEAMGQAVQNALPGLRWETEPELWGKIRRVWINREAIGYADNEFPYEWGGVYCSYPEQDDCDPSTTVDQLDGRCVPFPEEYALPPQTEISAGRIGEMTFVTFPGEPGTLLAEELLGRLSNPFGDQDVLFFGYSQDYLGYSILEDDWWQGGYEASGAVWGPRQGEYLVDMAEQTYDKFVVNGARNSKDKDAPDVLPPFDVGDYDPYEPTPGLDVGTLTRDASSVVGRQDVVVVTVQGGDPWLGTPLATLVDDSGDPVLTLGGKPVTSDGYAFWLDVVYDPTFADEPDAESRRFLYTFHLPVQLTVPGLLPELPAGDYRLDITLPSQDGDVQVSSATFHIDG